MEIPKALALAELLSNRLGIPVQRETVGYSLSKTDGFGFQDFSSPPPPTSPPVRGKYLKI